MPFGSTSNGRSALHKPQPDIGNEEDDYKVIGSEATNNLFTNLDFKVYPNPAQNNLSVVLGGLDNFEVNYVLLDALGKKILVTDKTPTGTDLQSVPSRSGFAIHKTYTILA